MGGLPPARDVPEIDLKFSISADERQSQTIKNCGIAVINLCTFYGVLNVIIVSKTTSQTTLIFGQDILPPEMYTVKFKPYTYMIKCINYTLKMIFDLWPYHVDHFTAKLFLEY